MLHVSGLVYDVLPDPGLLREVSDLLRPLLTVGPRRRRKPQQKQQQQQQRRRQQQCRKTGVRYRQEGSTLNAGLK